MKCFFNPFERIAGWPALVIGVAVMTLTAIVCNLNNVVFFGVLNVNPWATYDFSPVFALQFVNFLAQFLTMWLAGVCFSKSKLRVIDVAGTMALSRVPLLLMAIAYFLPITPESPYDIPRMIVLYFIFTVCVVWMITLMYNAYTVSCHLKGTRAIVSFIGALLVAEALSQIIFIVLISSLFTNVPLKNVINSDSKEVVVVVDSLTILQKTENVVKAFERGDFDAITVYFDETMKKGLPPSGLKMAWLNANMQFGKFENADMDNLKEISSEKYDIVEVPFLFQKEKLKLRLVFNKDGSIGGLSIQPLN